MLGLTERVFLYFLRAYGVFLIHISGMVEMEMQMKDGLKSYLSMFLFKDALDYAGYLPLFCLIALVGNYQYKIISNLFLFLNFRLYFYFC